uniref:Uncharacterized protein n=1 Tax=Vitis vinifera TaxID=29760 RepID=A5ATM1_VITVI|nr:hypothetical protein VITISV_042178 [Vitis vinifera]
MAEGKGDLLVFAGRGIREHNFGWVQCTIRWNQATSDMPILG